MHIGFSGSKIAEIFAIGRTTLWRRMREWKTVMNSYTPMSDEQLFHPMSDEQLFHVVTCFYYLSTTSTFQHFHDDGAPSGQWFWHSEIPCASNFATNISSPVCHALGLDGTQAHILCPRTKQAIWQN